MECITDLFQHIGAHVLFAGFDPSNGTLGGIDALREFCLGDAFGLPEVGDPFADGCLC